MIHSSRQHSRLILLFIVGIIALNYPILALFSKPTKWFGIPILYLYFFAFWSFFITAMAIFLEEKISPNKTNMITKAKG